MAKIILVKIVKSARICIIWSKYSNNLNSLKKNSISLKNEIGMCFCYQTGLSLECDIICQVYISWYLLDAHQVPRKLPWLYTRKTGENMACKYLKSRSFFVFFGSPIYITLQSVVTNSPGNNSWFLVDQVQVMPESRVMFSSVL